MALEPDFLFVSMAKETIEVPDSQQAEPVEPPVEPPAGQEEAPATPELPENDVLLRQLEKEMDESLKHLQEVAVEGCDATFDMSPPKPLTESLVECNQCGLSVSPADAQVRGTLTWWCNNCNAATKQLRSKMLWPPLSFQKLSVQEKRGFWREAHKLKEEDGELKYQRLRDVLVQQVGTKLVRELMKAKGGKYLPLGVYQKKLGQQLGQLCCCGPLGCIDQL